MQPRTLQIILFSFLLNGCAQVPPKPAVNLCTVDLPRKQLICAPTGNLTNVEQLPTVRQYIKTNLDAFTIPLEKADKFIAFSPDDWAKISAYAKTLRAIVVQNCQQ